VRVMRAIRSKPWTVLVVSGFVFVAVELLFLALRGPLSLQTQIIMSTVVLWIALDYFEVRAGHDDDDWALLHYGR
jgi:hypothetical protein